MIKGRTEGLKKEVEKRALSSEKGRKKKQK